MVFVGIRAMLRGCTGFLRVSDEPRFGPPFDAHGSPVGPLKMHRRPFLARSEDSLRDFRPEATVERTVQLTPHSQALLHRCERFGKVCQFLRDARIRIRHASPLPCLGNVVTKSKTACGSQPS
jgi:hypothetical protein